MFEIKGSCIEISITVKPNSKKFRVMVDENKLIVCLRSRPENNKANIEIIKEFQKIFKKKVSIVSGEKSKKKKILINNANESDIRSALFAVRD